MKKFNLLFAGLFCSLLFLFSGFAHASAMYEGILVVEVLELQGEGQCKLKPIAYKRTGGHVAIPDENFTYIKEAKQITRTVKLLPGVAVGDKIAVSYMRVYNIGHPVEFSNPLYFVGMAEDISRFEYRPEMSYFNLHYGHK